ncbi:MAG: hypothetical protein ACK583_15655 [Cyanobacteriota bacterium]
MITTLRRNTTATIERLAMKKRPATLRSNRKEMAKILAACALKVAGKRG